MARRRTWCDRPRSGLVVCDALPARTEGRCRLGDRGRVGSSSNDLGHRQRCSTFMVERTQEASLCMQRIGTRRRTAARGRDFCACPLPSRLARQPFFVLWQVTDQDDEQRSAAGQNQNFVNDRYRVIYRRGGSLPQRTESPFESRVAHSLSSARHMMSGCRLLPSNKTSP